MTARSELNFRIVHKSGAQVGIISLRSFEPPASSSDPMVDFEGLYLTRVRCSLRFVAIR
jgi:hypothetical protein